MLSSQLFIIGAALFAPGFADLLSDDGTVFIQQRATAGIETVENAVSSTPTTAAPLPVLVHGLRTMADMLLPNDQVAVPFRGMDDEICWVQLQNHVADRHQLNVNSQYDAKHRRSESAATDVEMPASAKYASFVFNTTSLEQALREYCDGGDSGDTEKYGKLLDWNVSQVTEIRIPNEFGPDVIHPRCKETFNGDVMSWNTAKVTTMANIFQRAEVFNRDISQWNTVMTKSLRGAFDLTRAFNQDIGEWTTSSVTDLAYVFSSAAEFNGNVGLWDTSKLESMDGAFSNSRFGKFNQPIGQWDTSRVTSMLLLMFSQTFNQDIGRWDTGSVVSFALAFYRTTSFNHNLQHWNVSNAETMHSMFQSAAFNNDLSGWSPHRVTSMRKMFAETSFNNDIGSWNTGQVSDMSSMFQASLFNQNLQQWDTSGVRSLQKMFENAAVFNGNIQQWDTNKVTSLLDTFRNAAAFDQDLSQWNVSSVSYFKFIGGTFHNSGLSNCSKYQIWSAWKSNTEFNGTYGDWSMYGCEAPTLADAGPLTLETNSLGSAGGLMRFSNIANDGTELVVENTTEYIPFQANVTGLVANLSSLAQISLGCGDSVEMKFEFMLDSQPVIPSAFNFTVADLDMGSQGRCSESVYMSGSSTYFLYPDEASSSVERNGIRFTGKTVGSVEDNPVDIFDMTTEQKKKAVTFVIDGTNGFNIIFATSEFGDTKDPNVVGYNGRRILFGIGEP